MGRRHGTGIDHGVAQALCLVTLGRFDPDGLETEGRIFGWDALQGSKYLAGIDRHITLRLQLGLTDDDTH